MVFSSRGAGWVPRMEKSYSSRWAVNMCRVPCMYQVILRRTRTRKMIYSSTSFTAPLPNPRGSSAVHDGCPFAIIVYVHCCYGAGHIQQFYVQHILLTLNIS